MTLKKNFVAPTKLTTYEIRSIVQTLDTLEDLIESAKPRVNSTMDSKTARNWKIQHEDWNQDEWKRSRIQKRIKQLKIESIIAKNRAKMQNLILSGGEVFVEKELRKLESDSIHEKVQDMARERKIRRSRLQSIYGDT